MLFRNKRELIDALNIKKDSYVLDVGFVGQAVKETDDIWPHAFLKEKTENLYGVDLQFDTKKFPAPFYQKSSAEDFSFAVKFDFIFAGDLIEHLSNPGLFLQSCKRALKQGGILVITTPNAFNLFSLVEKITHDEPNVNADHTLYLNKKVMSVLLRKNGINSFSFGYLYTLGTVWNGGIKRKIMGAIYWALSKLTKKFMNTLVVTIQT